MFYLEISSSHYLKFHTNNHQKNAFATTNTLYIRIVKTIQQPCNNHSKRECLQMQTLTALLPQRLAHILQPQTKLPHLAPQFRERCIVVARVYRLLHPFGDLRHVARRAAARG